MSSQYAGPDSELTPDYVTIKQFLTWWFRFCNLGVMEIGWLGADRKLNNFEQFSLGQWDELVARAVQENLVPGQSMYIRAATVRADMRPHTTDADFVQAPGPWHDVDTPEQVEAAKQVQTMVRPNGITVTGTVPHLRAQSYFRCTEPIASPELLRSLNKRVHRLYGGDPSVVNPTRLMRLPGSIAWPWKEGRVPELTRFVIGENRNQAYPLSLLTTQLPEEEATQQSRSAPPPPGDTPGGFTTASMLMAAIRRGEQWHNNMIRLVAHWVGRDWSIGEILGQAEGFTLPGYTVKQTIEEMTKAIDGARKRWDVPDEDPIISPAAGDSIQIIDPWDTLRPPAFPINALPGLLRDYVGARAQTIGADPCAIAWSAISACSAGLDGRTRLRMKRHDAWSVPPAIWVALIGRSSTKKSPIIADAWRPLEMLQQVALADYVAKKRDWDRLSKEDKKDTPEPPKPRRLLTHDATIESIQSILSLQDRGIGVLRDELAGFIGQMDKYSGNGNGGAADRAFWLQAFNGGSYVADRVSRTSVVNNLLVTVCGGIQPEKLAALAGLMDDGFLQRLVPIIVGPGAIGTDEPQPSVVDAYTLRLQGLVDKPAAPGAALSDAAYDIREQLERDLFALEQSEPLGSKFSSFVGKLSGIWGRLALVLSHIDDTGLGYIVSERAAQTARTLIFKSVIPHAARVYMTIGNAAAGVEATQNIAGYILAKKLSRILISDLTRNVHACRGMSVAEVAAAVSPLISGGWLAPETERPGNRAWQVNAEVHAKFQARAAREVIRRSAVREILSGDTEGE